MDELRVLALHGYHGSADLLRAQLGPLAEALRARVDFVYVDAPSLAAGDFGWWHAGSDEAGATRYRGWTRTRDWLRQFWRDNGPFDGVFGFSQGAALAALVAGSCASDAAASAAGSCASDTAAGADGMRCDFAMMVGGFVSGDARHAPLYDALRGQALPTLHIIGRADSIVSPARSQLLARRFEQPLVLEHDGGHVIAATPHIRRETKAFLERMAARAHERRQARADKP
ncbi:MAG TPA: hypothetical protein VIA18_06275 [Polyangia bacterium]|jgi:predicted esterase|nr:hypothetical protein [Polyangia bacterium]